MRKKDLIMRDQFEMYSIYIIVHSFASIVTVLLLLWGYITYYCLSTKYHLAGRTFHGTPSNIKVPLLAIATLTKRLENITLAFSCQKKIVLIEKSYMNEYASTVTAIKNSVHNPRGETLL